MATTTVRYDDLRNIVERYFKGKYFYVKTMLAAGPANLLINNISQPCSVFVTGKSSTKKSSILELCRTLPQTVWSNNFSAASFVSGARNMDGEDLLPRLRNKWLITPELSALFSASKSKFASTFGILTAVLDGRGYVIHTGFGEAGYADPIRFNWLGAIIRITDTKMKQMGAMGHRLLFLHINSKRETFHDMEVRMDKMLSEGRTLDQKLSICRNAISAVFLSLAQRYPTGIDWNNDSDNKRARCAVTKAAITLRTLRGAIEANTAPNLEDPSRLTELLYNISRGNAVMSNRIHVTMEDVKPVVAIMIDSVPESRKQLLLSLLQNKGELDTNEYIDISNLKRKTVLERFAELSALGVSEYTTHENSVSNNATKKIILQPEFSWLQDKKIMGMLDRSNLL